MVDPATPQLTDTTANRIAAALEEYNRAMGQGGQSTQPAAPSTRDIQAEIDEAAAEGDLRKALSLQQELLIGEQLKTAAVTQQTAAATARMAAASQILDFASWAPKAEALAKQRGISPDQWTSVEAWREAITYTKGAHSDEIVAATQAALRAELEAQAAASQAQFPTYARQSTAPTEDIKAVDLTGMPKDGMRFAQNLGIPIARYAAAAKQLEAYASDDGSIDHAPMIQEDVVSRDEYGDVVVKRGAF